MAEEIGLEKVRRICVSENSIFMMRCDVDDDDDDHVRCVETAGEKMGTRWIVCESRG